MPPRRSMAFRTRSRSAEVDGRQVRLERAVEVERVDTVQPMRLVAPLHGSRADVPQPTPHTGQGLAVAEPSFDLGERRLRQPLLGDVAHDHEWRSEARRASAEHGAGGQRDRQRHAVVAHGAGLEVDECARRTSTSVDDPGELARSHGRRSASRRGGRRSRRACSRTAARRVGPTTSPCLRRRSR